MTFDSSGFSSAGSGSETTPIKMDNSQRRGRPKLEEISSLIKEGAQSKSPIRCRFCKRTFPREKSLQAHQRIHTGERPYRCTHPGCHKSFVQSGQLRTHQRLHTGKSLCSSEWAPWNRYYRSNNDQWARESVDCSSGSRGAFILMRLP